MTFMKYIILIIAIFQIGCTNSPKTSLKHDPNIQKKDTCELKVNSFNFKGFEIGMNLKKVANLISIKKHNDIIYGELKHPEKYTIFKKQVSKLELKFFNNKLYSIFIETKIDFFSDVLKKFNLEQCSEGNINIIRVENLKLSLYYDSDYYQPKNPRYFLWVTDKEISPKGSDILKGPIQVIDEENGRLSDF